MKNWIKKLLGLTQYVSELDQFLQSLNNQHAPLSRSQLKEVKKYKTIYHLRDIPHRNASHRKNALWAFNDSPQQKDL